jgi:hypothetical protein
MHKIEIEQRTRKQPFAGVTILSERNWGAVLTKQVNTLYDCHRLKHLVSQ